MDNKNIIREKYPASLVTAMERYTKTLSSKELRDIILNTDNIDDYFSLVVIFMLYGSDSAIDTEIAERYYDSNGLRENKEKALYLFEKSANNGEIIANYRLAWHYYNNADYMRAIDNYEKCIKGQGALDTNKIGECYSCLGDCYLRLSEPNYSKAIEMLSVASDRYNEAYACRRLGHWYSREDNNYFDSAKAINYLEKAVSLGDIVSVNILGSYYLYGNKAMNINKNILKAEKIFLSCGENADEEILQRLGDIYLYGDEENGVRSDENKACAYYEKLKEINESPMINAKLGYLYFKLKKYKEAEALLLKAEAEGNTRYIDFLGRIYKDGCLGYTDKAKALRCYERSYMTESLNNVFTCYECIELMLETGNYNTAYKVSKYGLNKFNDICFEYVIADLILNKGLHVEETEEEAVEKMKLCIHYNSEADKANLSLGKYYLKKNNYRVAETYFLTAFNEGCADAGVFIGRMYEKGGGTIKRNDKWAYEWYEKAANSGSILGAKEVECWKKGIMGNYKRFRECE